MTKFFKEPLLHFVLLGAAIFFAYSLVAGPAAFRGDMIVISAAQQENLAKTFSRTWQRPPNANELEGLIQDHIREEIAYREGQALKLDSNDVAIRRRLRQKLEMLAEDLVNLTPPTDVELQEYFEENGEDYILPATFSIRQSFIKVEKDVEASHARAEGTLRELIALGANADHSSVGDTSLLPPALDNINELQLDRMFGEGFSAELLDIETRKWSGPVPSAYGLHLVYIDTREENRMPSFDEARDQIQREWSFLSRKKAIDSLYERLAENYVIQIDPLDPTSTSVVDGS